MGLGISLEVPMETLLRELHPPPAPGLERVERAYVNAEGGSRWLVGAKDGDLSADLAGSELWLEKLLLKSAERSVSMVRPLQTLWELFWKGLGDPK